MQVKKAGFLTKIIVLVLLVYMATTLLNLRTQLQTYQAEKDALAAQVTQIAQQNAQLSDTIQNKDDPAVLEAVARDKGFVKAGEKLFVDIAD
ncbi:MAG: septum formation initiator family protein [Oscillospiraceae bacterium]|nr:septum formation initiator family protein [Oscillospiraceae bacterium]